MFLLSLFLLYSFVFSPFSSSLLLSISPSFSVLRHLSTGSTAGKTCTRHSSLAGLQHDLWLNHGREIGQPRNSAGGRPPRSAGLSPPYPRRGLRKPFLSAGRLPFPFGGCLLCELMTVIITSLSSFVISNPQPERRGSGPFGEMEIFIKQIAV